MRHVVSDPLDVITSLSLDETEIRFGESTKTAPQTTQINGEIVQLGPKFLPRPQKIRTSQHDPSNIPDDICLLNQTDTFPLLATGMDASQLERSCGLAAFERKSLKERGRPRTRWMDKVEEKVEELGSLPIEEPNVK
ncbi:hypothetical protein TNCV_4217191 [Trichonephila clavipes]|nr:hypothetical protein TNCV_4217191 [Trichonephila clavipes]